MSERDQDSTVWLITGCSTGIGREIARAALEAEERVAITARKPEAVTDLVEAFPGQGIALALDVTDQAEIDAAVAATESAFGRIDVLVNNAGYGYVGAVEEGVDEDVRKMFDTNFFGAIAMIKAVLPGMRARKDGYIINISSMTGFISNPGNVYYSASKFALESLSEGLSKELAPLGLRVSVVEPGIFRTDWASRSMHQSKPTIPDYQATIGVRRGLFRASVGNEPGDPRKIGEAVVMLSHLESPPLRLLLGADVLGAVRAKLADLEASMEEWESITLDVGFRDE
ncbi:MAG: SDR family NAD(P)-dependent oxidoreductase [bacterium]|nr:short-chain dehydrogenase/reductase [Deltaproteobacteria bacterium]MCP4905952.1 SDR family NAD(P)-dependent oxidoreductase [bacterium]